MSKRILITGLNIITSLGLDLESSWAGIIAGKNGVKPITLIDTEGLQTLSCQIHLKSFHPGL
jgi:3-oxoacyl-[acyl-carrier-protein] synthase II